MHIKNGVRGYFKETNISFYFMLCGLCARAVAEQLPAEQQACNERSMWCTAVIVASLSCVMSVCVCVQTNNGRGLRGK